MTRQVIGAACFFLAIWLVFVPAVAASERTSVVTTVTVAFVAALFVCGVLGLLVAAAFLLLTPEGR